MKLYKIRFNNNDKNLFDIIRFCEKNKVSIYATWTDDDGFDEVMFMVLGASGESCSIIERNYPKYIKKVEAL